MSAQKSWALVFSLLSYAEASLLACFCVVPTVWSLAVDRKVLVHRSGEAEVLIFDLAVVAKALAQFEHSSEVLVFNIDASIETTAQFKQAMEVEEAFLGRCLCMHLGESVVAFGHAGAAALPSNMVDARLQWSISSVTGGCYESSCDTLLQPLILTACWWTMTVQHPL